LPWHAKNIAMADTLAVSLVDWLTAESLRGTPPVIHSSAFAQAPDRRDALVSLGRSELRRVVAPQELFAPDLTAAGA
jgi:hypothetical protein